MTPLILYISYLKNQWCLKNIAKFSCQSGVELVPWYHCRIDIFELTWRNTPLGGLFWSRNTYKDNLSLNSRLQINFRFHRMKFLIGRFLPSGISPCAEHKVCLFNGNNLFSNCSCFWYYFVIMNPILLFTKLYISDCSSLGSCRTKWNSSHITLNVILSCHSLL